MPVVPSIAFFPRRFLKRLLAVAAWFAVAQVCSLSVTRAAAPVPQADIPANMELVVAARPPLVQHPLMACFDDRGRLFVADAVGLNLRRKELEEQLPNRVLMLEDKDGDGLFDQSTVFADKMTFPQGACWLDGSLYVASPPGIWKFTDTDGDGVADRREMIVGGFDFDGNAADVHGPFLHPTNGRLYWCHGRKGHKVVQKDGTLVHEGKASGIWSCRPDGSDVQWHSLGSMDNPVEVDFTPEGDLFGVVNLYYNQPRGDTLMHWLYGGVYERPDQLAAIAGLPRTMERMPVVHNYGHVAVSGCTFYRSGALNPEWKGDMLVAFFNTQKVVRTKLVPAGATFTATEHELLKIHDPDVHVTDVLEDADGSLLVIDTGGWFRIGCPASLTAKPDLRGAIYRLRKKGQPRMADAFGQNIQWGNLRTGELEQLATDERWKVRAKATALLAQTSGRNGAATSPQLLDASQPQMRLRACEAIARAKRIEPAQRAALLSMLGEPLDPALEHAAMFAAMATQAFDLATLREAASPRVTRRLLVILEQSSADQSVRDALLESAYRHVDSPDVDLARAAVAIVARHPQAMERAYNEMVTKLAAPRVPRGSLNVMAEVTGTQLAKPEAQELITLMLKHAAPEVRQAAWRIIGQQSGAVKNPAWFAPIEGDLVQAMAIAGGPATVSSARPTDVALEAGLPLLLDAIAKMGSDRFDEALQAIIKDPRRPQPLRLKALSALSRSGQPVSAEAFALLLQLVQGETSPTARIDAARLLARAQLSRAQLTALAPVLPGAGPVELLELLKLARRMDPATGRLWAESLVRSPVFDAVEESAIKSSFSSLPPELYEKILAPAVRAAAATIDVKKRKIETLAAAFSRGRAPEGRKVYESSACMACHKVGELGRAMGPDLSRIGQIRRPRDLLESIIFPSATIARDYETHVVETSDGQSHIGMLKSDTVDGLVLQDVAGQEKVIPHVQVIANSLLATSLMPVGLEQTLTEQQLLDLIAWLASLQ